MPQVKTEARDGIVYFLDGVGTSETTYTYPNPQSEFTLQNTGTRRLIWSVGPYSDILVNPGETVTRQMDINTSSFTLRAEYHYQSFTMSSREVSVTVPTLTGLNEQLAKNVQNTETFVRKPVFDSFNMITHLSKFKNKIIISDFEEATGWTGGTVNTSIVRHGYKGLTLTSINGATPQLDKNATLNLLNKILQVSFHIDDVSKLAQIDLLLQVNGSWTTHFVTTHYGDYPYNRGFQSGWNTWSVGVSDFSKVGGVTASNMGNITALRLRIKSRTNETINVTFDMFTAVDNPQKNHMISLTFDDAHNSLYTEAKPRMSKVGYRGTSYVMPDYVGVSPYCSLEQLKELYELGWDISGHSQTELTSVSLEDAKRILYKSYEFLIKNGFVRSADHFAYPGGKNTPEIVSELKKVYSTGRVNIGNYVEKLPVSDPYRLRVISIIASTQLSVVQGFIDRAIEGNQWLILMIHNIIPNATGDQITPEFFQSIIDYLVSKNANVVPMSEAKYSTVY